MTTIRHFEINWPLVGRYIKTYINHRFTNASICQQRNLETLAKATAPLKLNFIIWFKKSSHPNEYVSRQSQKYLLCSSYYIVVFSSISELVYPVSWSINFRFWASPGGERKFLSYWDTEDFIDLQMKSFEPLIRSLFTNPKSIKYQCL